MTRDEDGTTNGSLVTVTANRFRESLIAGEIAPGAKLSEVALAGELGVSRNTLREVFRLLTSQRLLEYIPNRGVFVAAPDEAAVIDIYRVRRVIQHGAVAAVVRGHPALTRMKALSVQGLSAAVHSNWALVGRLNLEFHRAMVELCDSPRINEMFGVLLAELQLVFGQLPDSAHLHGPFVDQNARLYAAISKAQTTEAAEELDLYLNRSERTVLAAISRTRG